MKGEKGKETILGQETTETWWPSAVGELNHILDKEKNSKDNKKDISGIIGKIWTCIIYDCILFLGVMHYIFVGKCLSSL